jgi:hypothetical protein
MSKLKRAGQRKRVGRPSEGRTKVTCYPKPQTVKTIKSMINRERNTFGKVLDGLVS